MLTRILCILLPAGLAACAGPRTSPLSYAPESRSYPAPGPANDPWRPYIREASQRFGVPSPWIRAVMHQESGGHEYRDGQPITSAAGAMGLMQLMPATYADLQAQYGLGNDPFDPHDNIMAGTGYIRQMYDRYGSPGFLAAYNAGPARVDDYLAGEGGLPNETVNYVASIAPHLAGDADALTPAPLERRPVENAPPVELAAARSGPGCWHDPDTAFDPAAPCEPRPAPAPVVATVPAMAEAALVPEAGCPSADPDAAFDPAAPCPPALVRPARLPPAPIQQAVYRASPSAIGAYAPLPPPSGMAPLPPPSGMAASPPPSGMAALPPRAPVIQRVSYAPVRTDIPAAGYGGAWAIQVGAFGQPGEARFATAMARDAVPSVLNGAREMVMPVPGLGRSSLYRARLAGLDRGAASSACAQLRGRDMPCILVGPGG